MKPMHSTFTLLAIAFAGLTTTQAQDPLPTWNDGAAKKSIIAFAARVTNSGSPDFVPPAERIATFDNDGTLWAEQPMYFQLLFALHRVGVLAPQHPEWREKEPFASLLKGDVKAALVGASALAQAAPTSPPKYTGKEFAQRTLERRAVEAAVWGMPRQAGCRLITR